MNSAEMFASNPSVGIAAHSEEEVLSLLRTTCTTGFSFSDPAMPGVILQQATA